MTPTLTYEENVIPFMYEAEIIGGEIKGSDEDKAEIFPEKEFPLISSKRIGSQRVMQAYTAKVNKGLH